MADTKWTQEQLYALLQHVGRRLNMTPTEMASALSHGGIQSLADHLSPENAAKLQGMMGDKARAEQLLNSPQAQALIQKILQK